MLKELESVGDIGRDRGRRYQDRSTLPSVAVIEVTGVDTDGETTARPFGWTDGAPPLIYVAPEKRSRAAYAAGERVLARLKQTGPSAYEARVMRRLAAVPDRTLGVVTQVGESMRIVPVEKRARAEFLLPPEARMGAEAGELVWAEIQPGRPLALKSARVVERLGPTIGPKSISVITIHDHDIPHAFRPKHWRRPRRRDRRSSGAGSIYVSCRWSPSTARRRASSDEAIWAEPNLDADDRGGWRLLVAIADVAHYMRPDSQLDKAALDSSNSVYFPVVSYQCCRTSCRAAGVRWCRRKPPVPCRAPVDRQRQQYTATPLRAPHDALGHAADLSAGANDARGDP